MTLPNMEKLTEILCRICCENPGEIYIFTKNENDETPISAKLLHCCSNMNIKENDLSQYICRVCEKELSITYCFIKKCESADERFNNLCTKNIKYEYDEDYEIKEEKIEFDEADSGTEPYELIVDKDDLSKNVTKKEVKKNRAKINSYTCDVCKRKCANQSNFIIHMRSHTNEKPFACQNCDKKYKDAGNLKRHIERQHMENRKRNFTCDYCGKGFYAKSGLKIHIRTHTGEAPYACTMCPKRFKQISAKIQHQKRHKGEKTHTCVTCNKKFCTKTELNNHSQVHSSEKKYSCVICNNRFKHKGNVQIHMKLHKEPMKFICNYCGLPFNSKANLTAHIKRKHSSKAGRCDICEKDVSNIDLHMCRHTGERTLICEYCPKRYFSTQSLAFHINFKHTQTDRFKCVHNNCTLSFPSKKMLDYHITKQHENIKPHGCEICSRKFYRKSDLTRHTMGTHKVKPTL